MATETMDAARDGGRDDGAERASAFPPWLRKRVSLGGERDRVFALLDELGLATVCRGARCPNLCECFAAGAVTFMILGDRCSRDCRFCAVDHGPAGVPAPDEPERVAEAAARLKLAHVVITSVTRDDLPDGGAEHFRRVVETVHARAGATVEILTPDFNGDLAAVDVVAAARPEVFGHNLETAPRLYPLARPQAAYERSLRLLRHLADNHKGIYIKSGLMVGLGESLDEVRAALRDLRHAGVHLATIGQYLRPTPRHLPVRRFVTPAEFELLAGEARQMGFTLVESGPFVRSSYRAGAMMRLLMKQE